MLFRDKHRVICALDTGDLQEALATVAKLHTVCGAFKVGHGLTLPHGLDVINRLQDAGAERVFLDLKFHDIPNSVAVAVREAAKRDVWMLTLHLSGGPAMLVAAIAEARAVATGQPPLLVGVSVLTSLDQQDLQEHLGCERSLEHHMVHLSRLGVEIGVDGVVCSVHEAEAIRRAVGTAIVVTPGIRARAADNQDQLRVGDAQDAIQAGADYMVVGRALTDAPDPVQALKDLRFTIED